LLGFVHVDGQSSACHPLQAHLVLESHLPFRLILYWTRLLVDNLTRTADTSKRSRHRNGRFLSGIPMPERVDQ